MKPRAITGIGVASALGVGAEENLLVLRGAKAADKAPIASFDASKHPNAHILEVPGFDPTKYLGDKGLRTLDRLTKLLVVAARLALHDGGLKKDNAWAQLDGGKVGVCCSNAYGSLEAITELDRVAVLEDARYINPAKFPNTVSNSAAGYVSIWEDLRALNVSVSDGNPGALDAFSCADIFLETGRAEAILTGGGEAMSEALFHAFDKLGVLSPEARLGEGAAFFVVEKAESASARGAKVVGHVRGYGTAYQAPEDDVTLLFASRDAMARAIEAALADAGIEAKDVDVVASSLSGIPRLDDEERAAIEATLGGGAAIATPKRLFGETLGAGGALGVLAGLAWLGGAKPELASGAAPAKVETVLVTSVGYYGNASALVLQA